MKIIDETKNIPETEVLNVVHAEYVDDYRLHITFSDGRSRIVDFFPFLSQSPHPISKKYLQKKFFKQFEVVEGDLTWNDDEMIFPVWDLYQGDIKYIPPKITPGLRKLFRRLEAEGSNPPRARSMASSYTRTALKRNSIKLHAHKLNSRNNAKKIVSKSKAR
ncbi:MAG: DUF2442 domain-containing protein [Candidatus Kapaibacterium sp.]